MNLYHTTANPTEAIQTIQTLNRQGHNAAMIPVGGLYQIYILPPTPQHNGHKPTAGAKTKKAPAPKAQRPFQITFIHLLYAVTLLSIIIAALSK